MKSNKAKKPVEKAYREEMRPKKPHVNTEKKMIDGKMKARKKK